MKKSDNWNTPEYILARIRAFDNIALDPCSNEQSVVRATAAVTSRGLELDWRKYGLVFCNPPYSRGNLVKWMYKCASSGAEIIALVPADTSSNWFQHCWTGQAICFLRGRVKFLGATTGARFSSALVYWGKREQRFEAIFHEIGKVIIL